MQLKIYRIFSEGAEQHEAHNSVFVSKFEQQYENLCFRILCKHLLILLYYKCRACRCRLYFLEFYVMFYVFILLYYKGRAPHFIGKKKKNQNIFAWYKVYGLYSHFDVRSLSWRLTGGLGVYKLWLIILPLKENIFLNKIFLFFFF